MLTSDSSIPRSKQTIGLYVERLRELIEANPDPRALANQVRWLL